MDILYLHNVPIDSQSANLIQVKSMCGAMSRLGMSVTLSLPGQANTDMPMPERENYEFKVHTRAAKYKNTRLDKYLNFHSTTDVIKKFNPDLCYLRSPILLLQTLSLSKNIIIELHNNKLHQRALPDIFWKFTLKKYVKKSMIKKVVCISQALSDYWITQGLPKDKILTAHDGIEPKMFEQILSKNEARRRLGLPSDAKIVTYAGRLYKNRKINNIISLAMIYPQALFLIVGGPARQSEYFNNLSNSKDIKNVIFTGQVLHDLIPTYLYASDILLALWSSEVPTINYCSPLKLFEYMAAGRIIIAQGFPTIKEVLIHNKNAIFCEPESIDDLIKKTGAALDMAHCNKLGEQSRTDVFANYTWDQRAAKILQGLY